jgi:nitrogen fixation protein NifZ
MNAPVFPVEPRQPRYRSGQRVVALLDLYNDGSYPDQPAGALLVNAGDAGEIVQSGMHVESSTPVYMVEFDQRQVVGCLEEEISPQLAGSP